MPLQGHTMGSQPARIGCWSQLLFLSSAILGAHGQAGGLFGGTNQGDGTYYLTSFGSGACSFAQGSVQYSQTCGLCVAYKGLGPGAGANPVAQQTQYAIVGDLCPECQNGDLDQAATGDGRWKISWYPVQCNVGDSNFIYSFQGSNPYYIKLQIANTRVPVLSVKLKYNGAYVEMDRVSDNYFTAFANSGQAFNLPTNLQITSVLGDTVFDTLATSSPTGNVPGTQQFPLNAQYETVGQSAPGASSSGTTPTSSTNTTAPTGPPTATTVLPAATPPVPTATPALPTSPITTPTPVTSSPPFLPTASSTPTIPTTPSTPPAPRPPSTPAASPASTGTPAQPPPARTPAAITASSPPPVTPSTFLVKPPPPSARTAPPPPSKKSSTPPPTRKFSPPPPTKKASPPPPIKKASPPPPTTRSPPLKANSTSTSASQVQPYGQCGGLGAGCFGAQCGDATFPGVSCAPNAYGVAFGCSRVNAYYWQCVPAQLAQYQNAGFAAAVVVQAPPSSRVEEAGPCEVPIGNNQQCGGTGGYCSNILAGAACGDQQWPGSCCLNDGFNCLRFSASYWECRNQAYIA